MVRPVRWLISTAETVPPIDGHAPKKTARIHSPHLVATPSLSLHEAGASMGDLSLSIGYMPVADDVAQGFLSGPGASSQ